MRTNEPSISSINQFTSRLSTLLYKEKHFCLLFQYAFVTLTDKRSISTDKVLFFMFICLLFVKPYSSYTKII